jgi:signal transduction histidine kinase
MLALLGVFLVGVATLAADRLARSIVRPVAALSEAARSLGAGNLDTRVVPDGTPEIAEVGEAFNFLAERLGVLLSAERESVADLSHRLRTPLTALRLQAETLNDKDESAALLADIDQLERAVDHMIEEARRPPSHLQAGWASRDDMVADLAAVVRHRATFWKVLADEQGRDVTIHTSGGELFVGLSPDELGAVVDTLLENVFSYTPPGTGYSVTAGAGSRDTAWLVIEDDGPGFPDTAVVERGTSGSGSTGLGLDIVRRAAQRAGGRMHVSNRRQGGAHIQVVFTTVRRPTKTEVHAG